MLLPLKKLKGYKKTTLIENYKKILIVINPVLPHFSNECLEMIGNKTEIDWPNYDSKFLEKILFQLSYR